MTTSTVLLDEYCKKIADTVIDNMKMLHAGTADQREITTKPILYRWWFKSDGIVMTKLWEYAKSNEELATILTQLPPKDHAEGTYYALYFGKSENGRGRFNRHMTGPMRYSTLRRTLNGICFGGSADPANESEITKILQDCYFEYFTFNNELELLECVEGICITMGKYPLNIKGNSAIGADWLSFLTEVRNKK